MLDSEVKHILCFFRFSTLSKLMEKQLGVTKIPMVEPLKMSKFLLATNGILQLTGLSLEEDVTNL